MKIVITGRNFSTDNDEGLKMLTKEHEVIDYSRDDLGSATTEDEVIKRVDDADIIICGLEPYSRKVLDACKNLKMISRRGIGYDNIDIDACKEKGIIVTRTVGAVEGAVAEHVMAYILYFAKRVELQSSYLHKREWKRIMVPGAKTRTIGLVGFGGIGKEIAKRAVPFGMKVLYNCRHPKEEWEQEYNVTYTSLDDLLANSDYVSVNIPLTDETKGMFNKELFAKMKPNSCFINIARGAIVNENDLKDALLSKQIGSCAIDTFVYEPCTDSVLMGLDNCLLTPHTAPFTEENFVAMNNIAAKNILDYINHKLDTTNQVC